MIQYQTEEEVQESFWQYAPTTLEFRRAYDRWNAGATQNQLPTDVRCAFVDYVDMLQKSGQISDELADMVTLG